MRKIVSGIMVVVALLTVTPAWAGETEDAETAFRHYMTAFCGGQLDKLVDLLPASYITDIDTIIHSFAERMDAEIWDKGRDLVYRLCTAFISKKELIDEVMRSSVKEKEEGATAEDSAEKSNTNSDNVMPALIELAPFVKSDVMTLDSLKKTDAKTFVTALMPLVLKFLALDVFNIELNDPYNSDEKIDVSTWKIIAEKTSDDTVALTFAHRPDTKVMKLMEGKWFLEDDPADWKDNLKQARDVIETIDFTSDAGKRNKNQIMFTIGMIDLMLKQAESADTKEDMKQAIGNFFGLFMAISNREAVKDAILKK